MEIRITCDVKDHVKLEDLRVIQGELKTLSPENFAKLKNQIINEGFSFPCFVWELNGLYNLLDGTHRYLTLVKLKEEGFDIPLIPVVKIEARDLNHAKKKLLAVTSSYAKISNDGLVEFMKDLDFSILDDLDLEGICHMVDKVNLSDENDEWVGMPEFEAKESPYTIVVSFDGEIIRKDFLLKFKDIIAFTFKKEGACTWSGKYPYSERDDLSSVKYE